MALSATTNAQTIMGTNFVGTATPGMPAGWTNTFTGISGHSPQGWVTTTAATDLYFGTVPNAAPHTEYAVVNEYANPGNHPADMTSPTFSLTSATHPYLSYDYVYFGAYYTDYSNMEYASVEISTDGGTTWNTLDTLAPLSGATWTTNIVDLSSYTTSSNTKLRFHYDDKDTLLIGAAIGNISVFNAQNNDIALTAVAPLSGAANDYFVTGSSVTFTGTMQNMSPSTISSYQVSYSVDGGTPVTCTITASVAAMATNNFTCTTPYVVPTTGVHNVSMWVTEAGDPVLTNDTMTTAVYGVAFMPTKRLMFEEPTGSWCGYCVRGIVFMDSLYETYPDSVSICSVHDYNGYDPMAEENTWTEHYDTYMSGKISGFPSIVIDRNVVDDPSNAIVDYQAMKSNFGFADMTISATFGTSVTVSGTVTPAMNLTGDYRVELILTEMYVTAPGDVYTTSNGWSQHDYYATDVNNQPLSGAGYNFQDSTSGGVVSGDPAMHLQFHFVDRYTVPDMSSSPNGVASSLPSTMTAGTAYDYSFSAVSSTGTQAWNMNQVTAIVVLIDNNSSSPTYGQILNSVNMKNPMSLGVSNVAAGINGLQVYPNPATDMAHARFELNAAGKVTFNVTDVLGRVVMSNTEEMTAGGQQVNFSTASFAAGVYNVTVTTETGTTTQHLTVAK